MRVHSSTIHSRAPAVSQGGGVGTKVLISTVLVVGAIVVVVVVVPFGEHSRRTRPSIYLMANSTRALI